MDKQLITCIGFGSSCIAVYYLYNIYGKSFINILAKLGIYSIFMFYIYVCLICTKRIINKEITGKDTLLFPIFLFQLLSLLYLIIMK